MQAFTSRRSRPSRRRVDPSIIHLRGEALPERRMLAVFTVTSAGDSGPGSLRDAIDQANLLPGRDIVDFDLPSPSTIAINSELVITEALEVTGAAEHYGGCRGDFEGLSHLGRCSESASGNHPSADTHQWTGRSWRSNLQ